MGPSPAKCATGLDGRLSGRRGYCCLSENVMAISGTITEDQQVTSTPPGLQKSPVAEGGDLADARPVTRKAARACGCPAEDQGFFYFFYFLISRAALQV